MSHDKSTRGNASQFFVAGELCRRGYAAVVTMGNTPNTDVLCSNLAGTKFVHTQVKTFVPGNRTCNVGIKAEQDCGPNFFWVLGGIPMLNSERPFMYYIIPSADMSTNISNIHRKWLSMPGKEGRQHRDSKVRAVNVSRMSERGQQSHPRGRWHVRWSVTTPVVLCSNYRLPNRLVRKSWGLGTSST
ncbi:MAG TPA: hypothetical protein PKM43_00510 [Verrucomicrobiota bacterium]|nr:hypothetical protein [Verrucomicrobiota bacterium]HRZ35080.1 hypothetical protein [Candidatus Paceibacterota bacterium]HRZ55712.1 hypothetical protein [Candidatus Paceibacterota bacterium]